MSGRYPGLSNGVVVIMTQTVYRVTAISIAKYKLVLWGFLGFVWSYSWIASEFRFDVMA